MTAKVLDYKRKVKETLSVVMARQNLTTTVDTMPVA